MHSVLIQLTNKKTVHFFIAQLESHRVKLIRMVVTNNIHMMAYKIIPTLIKHNKEQQVK